MKKKIVITGGTGLIGSYLVKQLVDINKYDLILLTRNPDKYTNTATVSYVKWNGRETIPHILNGVYAIINLIGENIGEKRWSEKQRDLILSSRKDAANAISKSVELCQNKPQVWIQASASGFYGQANVGLLDESSPKGKNSFLADVCEEWEKPIKELQNTTIRKVIIRTGVVLAKNSDLWKQLTMSFTWGVAAIPGSGKQYLPWIHIDDEVGVILFVLDNENCSGVFNLSAPESSTMKDIIGAIKMLKYSFITLKIPRWFLQILFGKDKTNELILTNQHVVPKHLLENNFLFKYPSIKGAVENLLK